MTIEEKAKRYDESLEQLKGLIENIREGKYAIVEEDIIEIFPELQESEDEKVKRIIHSISNKISFHLHDIFTEEEFQCFDAWSNAWLKKQNIYEKQDIYKIWTNNDYDKVKSIEYLLHEFDNHNFDDWFNSLKKEWSNEKEKD